MEPVKNALICAMGYRHQKSMRFLPATKNLGGMEIMSKGRMDNILHTAEIDKRAKMYS